MTEVRREPPEPSNASTVRTYDTRDNMFTSIRGTYLDLSDRMPAWVGPSSSRR